MLLELAIADAYGAGFEFAEEQNPGFTRRSNDGLAYHENPNRNPASPHEYIAPGRYTDDTQMSIALAEGVLSGIAWEPNALAEQFIQVFRRDPRVGYSKWMYKQLGEAKSGLELMQACTPGGTTNGAAMRASVLGLFRNIDKAKEMSRVQASVTHNSPDGIQSALASSLLCHYFYHGLGEKRHLAEFIADELEDDRWTAVWSGSVSSQGIDTVRAAITVVMRNCSLNELLVDAVALTGDVDTVSAIAVAAASCCSEYVNDLSQQLYTDLENGLFGRDYLCQLDLKLKKFFEMQ